MIESAILQAIITLLNVDDVNLIQAVIKILDLHETVLINKEK